MGPRAWAVRFKFGLVNAGAAAKVRSETSCRSQATADVARTCPGSTRGTVKRVWVWWSAEVTGVSEATISRIESFRTWPDIRTVWTLLSALGITEWPPPAGTR